MISLPGSIGKRCNNILRFEKRIIGQDFIIGGTGGNQCQNITNAQAIPSYTGPPATLPGLKGNSVE